MKCLCEAWNILLYSQVNISFLLYTYRYYCLVLSRELVNKIQRLLDSITMYRVVLYGLSFLVAISLIFKALGILSYSNLTTLVLHLALITSVGFVTNQVLARINGIASNFESSAITTLILFFILSVPDEPAEWIGVALASFVAIASKYVITWRGSHIFNPAAFGVLVVSLMELCSGGWWIANETLFLPVLLVAIVVLAKLRQFQMFFAFLVPALVMIVLNDPSGDPISSILKTAFTLFPLLFLGSIMLTEPATMPNTRYKSLVFAALVGVVLASNIDLGVISSSPHTALIVGNLFAFIVAMRTGAYLRLVKKTQLTPTTYDYAFEPSRAVSYKAGQYMELTLHDFLPDNRGNRRTFTLASSPSDKLLHVAVKFYDQGSKFKRKLAALKNGDVIMGGHVGGDFVLPKNQAIPIVLVAGGIGVTPFISMIGEVLAQGEKRNITLYYFAADKSEFAYKDLLLAAKDAGITIHPRVGSQARLTAEDLQSHPGAHFYISGPPNMVNTYKKQLRQNSVKHILTDLFTGY